MPKNYQVNIQDSSCLFTFNLIKNKIESNEEKKLLNNQRNLKNTSNQQQLLQLKNHHHPYQQQQQQPPIEKSEYLLKTTVDIGSHKSTNPAANKPKKIIDIKTYGLNIKSNEEYILKKSLSHEPEKSHNSYSNGTNSKKVINNETLNANQFQKYRNYLLTPIKLKSPNFDIKPESAKFNIDLSPKPKERNKNHTFTISHNHNNKNNQISDERTTKYISTNFTTPPRIFTPRSSNPNRQNDFYNLKKPDNYKPTIKNKPFNYNSINRHFLDTTETLSSYFSLEKPSSIDYNNNYYNNKHNQSINNKRNLFLSSSSLFLSKNNKTHESTFTNSMSRSLIISGGQYLNLAPEDESSQTASADSQETLKNYYDLKLRKNQLDRFDADLTPRNLNSSNSNKRPKSSIGMSKVTPRTPRTPRTARNPETNTITPRKHHHQYNQQQQQPAKQQRDNFKVLKEKSIFLESTIDLNRSMGSNELNNYIDRLINQFRLKTRLNENHRRSKNATPDSKEVNLSAGTDRHEARNVPRRYHDENYGNEDESGTLVNDNIIIGINTNNNINTVLENEEIEESFLIESPMNEIYEDQQKQHNHNQQQQQQQINNNYNNNLDDDLEESTTFINFTHSYELDDTGSGNSCSFDFDEELYYDETNDEDTNTRIYT